MNECRQRCKCSASRSISLSLSSKQQVREHNLTFNQPQADLQQLSQKLVYTQGRKFLTKIHWTKIRISGKLPFATKKTNELAGNKEDSATELHKPWEKCWLGTGLHGLPLPPRGEGTKQLPE